MRSWVISCSVLVAVPAHADCPRSGKVIPVAHGSVAVDGNLDDATWRTACFIDDFEQKTPAFGAPPTRRVTAAVAIDGDTLYVAARMWSDGPGDIDDALTQRDDTGGAERFIVSLDPSHTRRLAYSFAVTAAGVRADWIHTDDTEGARDSTWNPVWRAATRVLADGWTAELAMPLSQLRLPATPQTSWGINFNWYVPRRNEDVFWRAVPPDRIAWASWFGQLTDLPRIDRGLAVELLPYATSRLTIDESPTDVLSHRTTVGLDAGLDARFRPLPGLAIAATINPDFGQVDVDPAFVNLSAFEVRLAEKRPFFIENAPLFADAGGAYFYSRRIGGPPLTLPSADELELPTRIRILAAAAAGGFIADHTQIAVLGAVTDSADADAVLDATTSNMPQRIAIAPVTGWAAARVEHQIGASVLGATATAVERDVSGPLSRLLPRTALVGGGDARLRSDDGTYEAFLFGGVSAVFGTPEAIDTVEESSAHYFQRPDAGYLHLDTTARRLVGWHTGVTGTRRAGPWQGNALVNVESPGLELNDLGVLQSADDIDVSTDVRRTETTPGARLFGWNLGAGASTSWNFGGLHKPVDLRASGDLTSNAFNTAALALDLQTPGGSDDLTRGGPAMRVDWVGTATLAASTPRGRAKQLSTTLIGQLSPSLPQGITASATATARVTPALRLDVTPGLTWITSKRQYVATVSDAGGGDQTFGKRYVFGELERREAQVELRATWSLSPDLVLTLYAQPFISVGRYRRLGELAAAGSSDVRWYDTTLHMATMREVLDGGTAFSIDEPDFTVASLRSTAVLRWELAPGSTLFVVWQQSRQGKDPQAMPLHSAAPDVFTSPGIHSLAIKLSYWFG